jgi:Mrp family chromosome partitioning ATPase/capsular polysaccharide biosynthesis protein
MDHQSQQRDEHDSGEGLSFAHARRAVYKRLKAVAALPIAAALLTTAVVLVLPNRYDASVVVQIDPRQKSANAAAAETAEPVAVQRTIESEIDALQSAPIIDRVIDELGLAGDPEIKPSLPAFLRGLMQRSPGERDTEAAVRDRLWVSRLRNTLLVTVRFSSRDAGKSARIANAIAGAYLRAEAQAKLAADGAAPVGDDHHSAGADTANADDMATASERVFQSLVAQYAPNLQVPGARVVTRAEPPRAPAAPKRKQLVAISFAAGLVVAIALALLLELKAPASAKSRNVEQALACPHMTSVPVIAGQDDAEAPARAARLVLAKPACDYAEAVRNACNELQRRRTAAPSRLVLVVSALPGEGAELFASNMAHHLAITGASPLLVDADLRMKALTRQLAGHCGHGLLDQIASHRPVEDAILRDGVTGLHFLPAAGPAPTPLAIASALRSAAFTEAIQSLKQRFATIIVAAPPLLPVSDARVIADLADQIVFVTAWQKTPRALAQKALTSLGANQRKVTGAVLTDVSEGADAEMMSFADIFQEIRRATAAVTYDDRAA